VTTTSPNSSLNATLRYFEAAEANLDKLTRQLRRTLDLVPDGIAFGSNTAYEDGVRGCVELLVGLPPIDGWRPSAIPLDLDEIARRRLDADEINEPELLISLGSDMEEPERQISAYAYRLNRARRRFIREAAIGIAERITTMLVAPRAGPDFSGILVQLKQIDVLLGSAFPRPHDWAGMFVTIENGDANRDRLADTWTAIRERLVSALYDDAEPLPIPVIDLGSVSRGHSHDVVVTQLNWRALDQITFERLIFSLISTSSSYENAAWLTRTNAADAGRDLSAIRVSRDSLAGVTHSRVIVQCKHWLERSIGPADVGQLRDQMALWEPAKVDVLIIATSGRFTSDAVQLVEKHNNGDRAMKIEMWPESHIERLLAERPGLVAEFRLR